MASAQGVVAGAGGGAAAGATVGGPWGAAIGGIAGGVASLFGGGGGSSSTPDYLGLQREIDNTQVILNAVQLKSDAQRQQANTVYILAAMAIVAIYILSKD
jgi:hypothetical protein